MGEERESLENGGSEKERSEVEAAKGGGVVMDTPERNRGQITTPMSKFEDSPVFNFLNSLSPIQPAKSIHITQSFNSLSFASLPSVFTSPHVSSLKDSRFLRRHQLSDPSKPEFCSDSGNKVESSEGTLNIANNPIKQDSYEPGSSVGAASRGPSYECSKLAVELLPNLDYDCSSPTSSLKPSCGIASKNMPEFAGSSIALVPFVQEMSESSLLGREIDSEVASQIDQNRDDAVCDWENMISDAADLLIFDSPNDAILKRPADSNATLDSSIRSYSFVTNEIQNTLSAVHSSEHLGEGSETENLSTQPAEGTEFNEFAETQDILASSLDTNCMPAAPTDKMDNEFGPLYRGMRRRCLVFEMGGARRKHLDENTSLPQSDGNTSSSDKQLVPAKPGNDTSRCILPGIGLHLNALAATPKDFTVLKHEAIAAGKQLLIKSGPSLNYHSLNGQGIINNSLTVTSSETEMAPVENGVPLVEDASQASGYMANEELNETSPKKKRRRLEHGESEACKRCNCKKSKCLKLYCECFAAGVYCVEPCSCQECFNKPIHEDTVLATRKQIESRNPLAFAPKVIRSSDSLSEIGDDSSKTPASARHKRGCNCKKSGCLKKYCECYQGGVGCSINCRCEGCKNAFGRKDGQEAELEQEEIDICEKNLVEKNSAKTAIQNDEQNPDSAPPATPLRFGRPSVQIPFSTKNKPPRSFSIGSSSLYHSQSFVKPSVFQPQLKFDKHLEMVREEEIPDILQGNGSPISGVKSASPNSKRVSPPHCEFGMSPGRRSSRKLILQSIPSFPSLTPKH